MAYKIGPSFRVGWRPRQLPQKVVASWRVVFTNPLIGYELRLRLGNWRGLINLGLCTALLVAFGLLNYSTNQYSTRFSSYNGLGYSSRGQQPGTSYFMPIVVVQLVIMAILACTNSAATIASEKERQTYDVLTLTLLRPRDIVLGKLAGSLGYLLLVGLAGLPVISLAFLIGGVDLDQLVVALVILVLTALTLSVMGVFWSSIANTAKQAGRSTFLNILASWVGFQAAFIYVLNGSFGLNGVPFYARGWVSEIATWVLSLNPVYALLATGEIVKRQANHDFFFYRIGNSSGLLTPFLRFLILSLFLSWLYGWLTVRRLRPTQAKSPRPGARRKINRLLRRNT